MIRESRKKRVILENRAPFPEHIRAFVKEMELLDWLEMNLRLDGSNLTRENIKAVLDGEVMLGGRIMDHLLIERLRDLLVRLYGLAAMKQTPDGNMVRQIAGMISGSDDKKIDWRKTTPVLRQYGFTPPLPSELPGRMQEFFQFASSPDESETPFPKAAEIHDRFLKIYPLSENNEFTARALMEYHLIVRGYPAVTLRAGEQEYNRQIAQYIQRGRETSFGQELMEETSDRFSLMIQLTEYEN